MNPKLLKFLLRWVIYIVAVFTATYIVSGIHCDDRMSLIIGTFVLSILNTFIRPLLMLLSLPIMVLTLGLFTLIINALLLSFVGSLVKGFHVDSFWAAFWGALVIGLVSLVLHILTGGAGGRVQVRRDGPPDSPGDGGGPVIDV